MHRRRRRRALPELPRRLPEPVPRRRRETLRVLGPDTDPGSHRPSVQRPDVRFARAPPPLHADEERGRVVALRGMGGACSAGRAALPPDRVGLPPPGTREVHAGPPLPEVRGKEAQGEGSRRQSEREIHRRRRRPLRHGSARVLFDPGTHRERTRDSKTGLKGDHRPARVPRTGRRRLPDPLAERRQPLGR